MSIFYFFVWLNYVDDSLSDTGSPPHREKWRLELK